MNRKILITMPFINWGTHKLKKKKNEVMRRILKNNFINFSVLNKKNS